MADEKAKKAINILVVFRPFYFSSISIYWLQTNLTAGFR
jgi:hypothetical protein